MTNSQSAQRCSATLKRHGLYDFFKRAADIFLSLLALILLSPLFLIICIAVKATDRGPVMYLHERVGWRGKPLYIYKFRSMVVNADELMEQFTPEQKKEFAENYKLQDDPRVTKIGKLLRKTSLDELPQLINILKGEMSFVGPRPITQAETEFFGSDRELLLSVKPGLTGYWASHGRSTITYKERIAMELYYVTHRSVLLDIKIIFRTFIAVFKGEGAH